MVFQSKGTGAINLAAGSSGVNLSNGGTVTAITRTVVGSGYTTAPSVAITAPTTAGGVQATASVTLGLGIPSIAFGGTGYTVSDVLTISGGTFTSAATVTVASVSGGVITSAVIATQGSYTAIPTSPASVTGGTGSGATFTLSSFINVPTITNAGSGYVEQPAVTFSGGGGGSGAAVYATVGSGTVVRSLGTSMSFYMPQGEMLRITDNGSATANYANILTSAATIGWYGGGAATNISMGYVSKGTGAHNFGTGSGTNQQFTVAHTASAVNYVQVTGGTTATKVVAMSAQGSDANIDLVLTPKGTGVIQFGTYTASVLTPTGYITIKDSGGTTRRILVG
jgi:hypothetical protein